MDNVCNHLQNFPTHHACVHWYNYHRVTSKSWRLFGKNTDYFRVLDMHSKYYFDIEYIPNINSEYNFSGKEVLKSKLYGCINRNHKYIITLKDITLPKSEDQFLYMKSYRKFPKAYMKDWKEINKIMQVLV